MIRKTILILLILAICLPAFSAVRKKYKSGLLVEVEEEVNGVSEREVLTYSDGHLLFTSHFTSESDVPDSVEYYIRAGKGGRLIGVRRLNRTNIFGDSFLYQEETMYLKAAPNLVVDSEFEIDSSGEIVYEKDGVKKKYTSDGVLLSSEDEYGLHEYSYSDDGNLESVTLISGNEKTVSIYTGNDISREEKYVDGIIIYSVDYPLSGKIKTIYENGVKTAQIVFEKNNVRIDRIEYY